MRIRSASSACGARTATRPATSPLPEFNPDSPQFGNQVHCDAPSNDGLIYVCDRTNDRIQIFKYDGTFVKQVVVEPNTRGDGSVWDIALSPDPEQKFMYIADGANEKIHVFDRKSMTELYSFGDGGRQPGQFYAVHCIAINSKGDILPPKPTMASVCRSLYTKGWCL